VYKQSEHLEHDFRSLHCCLEQEVTVWWPASCWGREPPDLVSVFSLAFGKWRLRVKGRKRRKLAGKSFLGQNHYAVPCRLLVANPLFKIISLAVTRTVKSGHSLRLSSFALEAGISFFS